MAKLVVTKPSGERFEISDLSFSEIKELAGLNGHGNGHTNFARPSAGTNDSQIAQTNYRLFSKALTAKAKKFVAILRENSQGISAESMAEKLGFESGNQIGGLAGGGMGKSAKKYGVDLNQVYRREVNSENGVRQVLYFPGRDIGEIK